MKEQISIRIENELLKKVEEKAQAEKRTRSQMINVLIERSLKNERKKENAQNISARVRD